MDEIKVCREYMGEKRGQCGKVAIYRIGLPGHPPIYKCNRHAKRFMADTRLEVSNVGQA